MEGQPHANTVELDIEAEVGELHRAYAEADVLETALEAETAGHDPAAWATFGEKAADVFAGVIVPNWQLEAEDKHELAVAIAEVLDRYFPGAVSGADNWHPLAKLAFVLGTVTAARGVDWTRLELKPLHARKDGDDDDNDTTQRRDVVLPDGDDPQRKNGRGFSIGGG